MIDQVLQLTMPDFLGIGAHRSGTTWLWHNVRKHPAVWTPETKELHFFDRHLEARYLPLLPRQLEAKIRYIRFFVKAKIAGQITGEFTPAYAILPKGKIRLIHSWIPDARMLFIMRDPVFRAWSHAKKDFLKFTGIPLEEASLDELTGFFELPAVVQRGDYYTCLKNWMEVFDRRQFYICFTKEIETKPRAVLRGAFKFLGLDPQVELDRDDVREPVHVSPSIPLPDEVRDYLANTLYDRNADLVSLLGREVPWG